MLEAEECEECDELETDEREDLDEALETELCDEREEMLDIEEREEFEELLLDEFELLDDADDRDELLDPDERDEAELAEDLELFEEPPELADDVHGQTGICFVPLAAPLHASEKFTVAYVCPGSALSVMVLLPPPSQQPGPDHVLVYFTLPQLSAKSQLVESTFVQLPPAATTIGLLCESVETVAIMRD